MKSEDEVIGYMKKLIYRNRPGILPVSVWDLKKQKIK